MTTLTKNVRFAVRSLLRSPGFFLVAVLTLALGIATNTAIFSIVNALLLRPYPYTDPESIVLVRAVNPKLDIRNEDVSYQDFLDLRERSESFEEMGAVRLRRYNLAGASEPIRVKAAQVSAGLFPLLGGRPLLGRTFSAQEDRPGAERVAVLSEPLWRQAFSADPAIVGKAVRIDGQPTTVIGVVPPSAQFPDTDAAVLFLPFALDPAETDRSARSYMVLGRLKPGVSAAQAESELAEIARNLERDHLDTNSSWSARVMPLREFRTRRLQSLFLILLGVVGLVLLIACVNVANLLLQRATVRQREMAIRSAMGAGRSQVVGQLLTESLVLALLGGVLGLLLATWGLRLLVGSLPQELPSYMNGFGLDVRVLGFLLAVSVLTAILFGLLPALRISRPNLTEALVEAGARSSGGARTRRLRNGLIVFEVALSIVLLIAAGLMVKSFKRLQNVDPGFEPRGALTMELTLETGQYREPGQKGRFVERLLERVGAVPGVQAAAVAGDLPIGDPETVQFHVEGQTAEQRRENPEAGLEVIGGDYFRALGIPLRRGRDFGRMDFTAGAPPVAIVNAELARIFWPGEDPIGRRLQIEQLGEGSWLTVVGVAADVKGRALADDMPPEIYVPYSLFEESFETMRLVARTASDPLAAITPVQAEIRRLDRDLPLSEVRTLDQAMSRSFWLQRLSSTLFGVFAAVGLLLATIGIYGTVAYSVSQRGREIGIRMALGARAADVVRMVVRQGMMPVVIATVVGLAGAFALGRVLRRLLFGVRATDPATFVTVTLVVVAVALLASYIPARRATRVSPVTALKSE